MWGNRLQTSFQASYNNKGGADVDTYEDFAGFGPSIEVHESTRISSGLPTGTGRLVTMNNTETLSIAPSSMLVFRGDLTYYRETGGGSHELKTGIWAAPALNRDVFSRALNDGFNFEAVRQATPRTLLRDSCHFDAPTCRQSSCRRPRRAIATSRCTFRTPGGRTRG